MKRIAVIVATFTVGALTGVIVTTAINHTARPECPILTTGCPAVGPITATAPVLIMRTRLKAAVGTPALTATEAELAAQRGTPEFSGTPRLEQAVLAVLPRGAMATPTGQPQRYRPDTLVWAIHELGVCSQRSGADATCFGEALVMVDAQTGSVIEATGVEPGPR